MTQRRARIDLLARLTVLVIALCAPRVRAELPEAQASIPPERIDGRPPHDSLRNEALVVPRLLLAPPRLLIRALEAPIGKAAAWNEREHAMEHLVAAVTWKRGTIGLRPAFQFTRDFRPLVGATIFANTAFGKDTRLVTTLLTMGRSALLIDLFARPTPSRSPVAFDFEAHYLHRDDLLFVAIPSLALPGAPTPASRFAMESVDLIHRVAWHRGPVVAGGEMSFGWRRYDDGRVYRGDRGIELEYCQQRLGRCVFGQVDEALVPGYAEGGELLRARGFVELDTRKPPFGPSSGVFGGLSLAYTESVSGTPGSYLRFSGALGGSVNLYRNIRFFVVRLAVDTLASFRGTPVFTELPTLGGPDDLRGFRLQRFRDFSTAMLTLEYRWQIWLWADAAFFLDVGTTGGQGFRGFTLAQLHPDIGVALRIRTRSRFFMRIQLAYGWGDGFQFAIVGGGGP